MDPFLTFCDTAQAHEIEFTYHPRKDESQTHLAVKNREIHSNFRGPNTLADALSWLAENGLAIVSCAQPPMSRVCPICSGEMNMPSNFDDRRFQRCTSSHVFELQSDSPNKDTSSPAGWVDSRLHLFELIREHELSLSVWCRKPLNLRLHFDDTITSHDQHNYGGPIEPASAHAVGELVMASMTLANPPSPCCPECASPVAELSDTEITCQAGHIHSIRYLP